MSRATFMLCAGGTGGHLFPAQAVGEALVRRGHRAVLAVDRRAFAYLKGVEAGFDVRHLASRGMKPGLTGRLVTLALLGLGYVQAHLLILRHRPAAVIGFGGYPSLPPVLAARHQGRPILLFEQNAVLGRANRWLARYASAIAGAFPDIEGMEDLNVPLTMTGNPVRQAIAALRETPYTPPAADGPFNVLVIGGSQGATVFSKVLPPAIGLLPFALRKRLVLCQQCRPADIDDARVSYARLQQPVTLETFFSDMPDRLAAAHLVICRAGASTIAELTAAGRPSILVPYPHAADDHQTRNAEQLAARGAVCHMAEPGFTPEALSARLEALMTYPGRLAETAEHARQWGCTDAAARLADLVIAQARTKPVARARQGDTRPAVADNGNTAPQTTHPETAEARS